MVVFGVSAPEGIAQIWDAHHLQGLGSVTKAECMQSLQRFEEGLLIRSVSFQLEESGIEI